MEFSKFFLNSGKPFVYKNMVVKHPTLNDINALSNNGNMDTEGEYFGIVMSLICDPYYSMVELYDNGIDYADFTNFDMFVYNWQKIDKLYKSQEQQFQFLGIDPFAKIKFNLGFFLGEHDFDLVKRLQGDYILYDKKDTNYVIDGEMYGKFVDFIKAINNIKFKDKLNVKNPAYKKMLVERMRKKEKLRQENSKEENIDVLSNIKTALCVTVGGLNYLNIDDLPIYCMYSYLQILQDFTVYKSKLNGLFSGMVSSDAFSQKDWDWLGQNK